MAFFFNWRVQLAILKLLDDDLETLIASKERAYKEGDTATQEAIFMEYQLSVHRSQLPSPVVSMEKEKELHVHFSKGQTVTIPAYGTQQRKQFLLAMDALATHGGTTSSAAAPRALYYCQHAKENPPPASG